MPMPIDPLQRTPVLCLFNLTDQNGGFGRHDWSDCLSNSKKKIQPFHRKVWVWKLHV